MTAENAEDAERDGGYYCGERGGRGDLIVLWVISVFSATSAVQHKADAKEEGMMEERDLNRVTEEIIGAAIEVHRALGPGLLESAYEACLFFELTQRGLRVERQKPLPVVYRDVRLDCGYRLDLLVEDKVIVEIKAVDQLAPIHQAQLLSYLRLSGCSVGLLINFNVRVLRQGLRRLVNNYSDSPCVQR